MDDLDHLFHWVHGRLFSEYRIWLFGIPVLEFVEISLESSLGYQPLRGGWYPRLPRLRVGLNSQSGDKN